VGAISGTYASIFLPLPPLRIGPTLFIRAHSIGVPTLHFFGAMCSYIPSLPPSLPPLQIGSILGPTLVIRAHSIGVPTLYFFGALCMLLMVVSVFLYVQQFGVEVEEEISSKVRSAPSPPPSLPPSLTFCFCGALCMLLMVVSVFGTCSNSAWRWKKEKLASHVLSVPPFP